MRLKSIAVLAALSLPMIACRSSKATPSDVAASASPSSALSTSAVAAASASARSSAGSCVFGPRICGDVKPGPYSPPPDVPPPEAEAAPAPSAAPSAAPRKLGTLDDWVKAYVGSDVPESKRPPQLGVITDVPSLPRTSLVYVRSSQIVRVDFPGGAEARLTSGPSANRSPRWTRDAQHIFFVSNRDGGVEKIFRMRSDGSAVEAISKGIRSGSLGIQWNVADDGAHIAYVPGEVAEASELHVVDVATKADEVVYRDVQIDEPSFSRDGKTLFVVQGWFEPPIVGGEHPKTLRSIDLASRRVTKLPNAGVSEITSPWDLGDGRLLFAASSDFSMAGREPRMHVMPSGGGAWADLNGLSAPAGWLRPVPSPDRKKIAVATSMRQGGFGADWVLDVEVVPFEAGPGRRLTPDFPRPFYSADHPTWATDSRHLAFTLALCPYVGCEPMIRSVVIVDTESPAPKLAFVGYGGSPEIAPTVPR
jgi:Tol biopolymer transport system component